MSLLRLDGFDHYGATAALLTQGPYAQASGCALSAANPRTGTRHLRITAANEGGPREVLGADLEEFGKSFAFYLPTLPTDSQSFALASVRDNGNAVQCTLVVSSTGQIILKRGSMDAGVVLATSAPVVIAGSYQHCEYRIAVDAVAGACYVRLIGVTVLNVAGVNTGPGPAAQVLIGSPGVAITGFPAYVDLDDSATWDTAGALNNDFIGDKKVYTTFPDADTATEEWDLSTGVDSFALVNNVPPDDAAQYLYADAPGPKTILEIAALPLEIVSIAGVMTATRMWKTDAGNAKVTPSIISDATEEAGTEHALSMAPTYYFDIYETDPDTSALWTVAGINAAQVAVERNE